MIVTHKALCPLGAQRGWELAQERPEHWGHSEHPQTLGSPHGASQTLRSLKAPPNSEVTSQSIPDPSGHSIEHSHLSGHLVEHTKLSGHLIEHSHLSGHLRAYQALKTPHGPSRWVPGQHRGRDIPSPQTTSCPDRRLGETPPHNPPCAHLTKTTKNFPRATHTPIHKRDTARSICRGGETPSGKRGIPHTPGVAGDTQRGCVELGPPRPSLSPGPGRALGPRVTSGPAGRARPLSSSRAPPGGAFYSARAGWGVAGPAVPRPLRPFGIPIGRLGGGQR